MNILQEKCFTKAWLDEQRERMQRVDPGLLEKSIHALELVGLLAQKEIPFSFKGGTCMLLLNRLKGGSPEAYYFWLKAGL